MSCFLFPSKIVISVVVPKMGFISHTVVKGALVGNVLWNLFPLKTWKSKLSEKIILTTHSNCSTKVVGELVI